MTSLTCSRGLIARTECHKSSLLRAGFIFCLSFSTALSFQDVCSSASALFAVISVTGLTAAVPVVDCAAVLALCVRSEKKKEKEKMSGCIVIGAV